jgi:plasmid maintenance system antidote protein VapI
VKRLNTPPQHGERRCYLRGCRQPECRAAHLKYCKSYDIRRHREGPSRIDATDSAEHLRRYINEGWSQQGIADQLNIHVATIGGLASGRHKTCSREHEHIILAFDPDFDADRPGYWTSVTGPSRRIRALAVLGHPLHAVALKTGISYAAIRRIARESGRVTSKDFANRIAEVFDAWSRSEGPSRTARGMAIAQGWQPLEAWQDIDDPQCQPSVNRDEIAAWRRGEITHLASYGIPEHEIAERLDMSREYVHDLLRELHTGQRRDRTPKAVAA